ncbi:membrane-associated zinc metalloprotease [Clostridium sp. CAG:1219]|nr:membrane-associated zinc metalloprotease [Clostridium sp. CAG:1219]
MLGFILVVVKLLIILGIVATIHEFGHFLFSKMFKVGVNEFSIGFGPKIVQKKFGETMYSLRCIPLGGYCAIEGEEGTSDKENSLQNKNLIQKVLILLMGAGFNAILAAIIFFFISFTSQTYTTKIESISSDSILYQAGIQSGDTINSINGKKVRTLSEVLNFDVSDIKDGKIEIEYTRDNVLNKVTIENAVKKIGYLGITFNASGDSSNVIDMVASGGKAFDAGLKAGDKIVSIASVPTNTSKEVVGEIIKYPNQEIEIVISRKGEEITKTVVPESKNSLSLGITSTIVEKTNLYYAFVNMGDKFKSIIGSYVDLFTGKVGIKDMSGIVGIGEIVSKSNGFLEFINLLGIISLAVGVANILPFPPLDGGKIVIVVIESIVRKKLSEKAEAIISYIGFGLLIALTIFVTYRDIIRII